MDFNYVFCGEGAAEGEEWRARHIIMKHITRARNCYVNHNNHKYSILSVSGKLFLRMTRAIYY